MYRGKWAKCTAYAGCPPLSATCTSTAMAMRSMAMARDENENDTPHNGATPSARPPRKLPASFASGPPKPKVRKLPRFGGEHSATHAMPDLVLQQPAICSWHAEEVDLHCDGLLRRHVEGTLGPLGFDVEWPVTFRQGQAPLPVATVQLAADGDVFVFQVSPARGGLPPRLRALLEEPTLPKVRAPDQRHNPTLLGSLSHNASSAVSEVTPLSPRACRRGWASVTTRSSCGATTGCAAPGCSTSHSSLRARWPTVRGPGAWPSCASACCAGDCASAPSCARAPTGQRRS